LFKGVDLAIGLRVSREAEIEGLDLAEHASDAYPPEAWQDGAPSTGGSP
jgi:ammonia channel protein AmtB